MRLILIVSLLTCISGCSLFSSVFDDKAADYLNFEEYPRMKMVEGQSPLLIQDVYVVPKADSTADVSESAIRRDEDGEFIVPQPMALIVENEQSSTLLSEMNNTDLNPRIERDGAGTQVLRLDGQFALAWTVVANELVESDYQLSDLNRSIGTYYLKIFDPMAEPTDRTFWQWLTGSEELGADVDYLLKMNRSRLGVYLSLQKDTETLADDALSLRVMTDLKKAINEADIKEYPRIRMVEEAPIQSTQDIDIATPEAVIPNVITPELADPQPVSVTKESEQASTPVMVKNSNGLNPRLAQDEGGNQILRLNGQFETVWYTVAKTLIASDYKLMDLDRSTGVYAINFFDPSAESTDRSFIQWLVNTEVLGADVDYLLKMSRTDSGVYLSLYEDAETLAEAELTQRVMADLKKLFEE